MKKIILIGGDLASGKSTYSNLIKERFNISLFNKDILKEIFAEEIQTHSREENKKLSVCCFRVYKYMVEQDVSPVIFESNFKPYEMEELTPLLFEKGYDVLSIRLTGTNEIMHKRFLDRLEGRPEVHKSQDLSKLEDYIEVVEELRSVKYPGKVIDINADNFDYQKEEKYFDIIEEFFKK